VYHAPIGQLVNREAKPLAHSRRYPRVEVDCRPGDPEGAGRQTLIDWLAFVE